MKAATGMTKWVKGKEGLVVEKPDILDKYCRKHKSVGLIFPSQFAKIYESTSKVPKKYCIDELDDEDDLDIDDADLEIETEKSYAGNQNQNIRRSMPNLYQNTSN